MDAIAFAMALVALTIALVAYFQTDGVPELREELQRVRQTADAAAPRNHKHWDREPLTPEVIEKRSDRIREVADEHDIL